MLDPQPWMPISTAPTNRAMHTTTVAMSAGTRQRVGMTRICRSLTGPSEPSTRRNAMEVDCAAPACCDDERPRGAWD